MEKNVAKMFKGQVLALGQKLLLKQRKTLVLSVKTIDLADLDLGKDHASGAGANPSPAVRFWGGRGPLDSFGRRLWRFGGLGGFALKEGPHFKL